MAEKNNIVIYHADCPDGFGAAFAAWLKLGDDAEYLPFQYGMEPPVVCDKNVFIADFSFSQPVMETLDRTSRKLVLLDHHATAEDGLKNFRCLTAEERLRGKTALLGYPWVVSAATSEVVINTAKSGARLAWEYFHGSYQIPDLIQFVEDRDIWKLKFGSTGLHFLSHLDTVGFEFQAWKGIMEMDEAAFDHFVYEGGVMHRKFMSLVDNLSRKAMPVTIAGSHGLLVNSTREFGGELGDLLVGKSGTFAAIWTLEPNKRLKVSLRSQKPFDVRAIAEQFGGGGHPSAAAFQLPAERFAELVSGQLNP